MTAEEARFLLNLLENATPEAINSRYQELYSDYRLRLDNAPTPNLKKLYQKNLQEVEEAKRVLLTEATQPPTGHEYPSAQPIYESRANPIPPPQDATPISSSQSTPQPIPPTGSITTGVSRLRGMVAGAIVVAAVSGLATYWLTRQPDTAKNPIGIEIEKNMVLVEGGLYQTEPYENDTIVAEQVNTFYLSKYEITQLQWEVIMDDNPSYIKNCPRCPVENFSWNDLKRFIEKLNHLTGKKYRLPTETEWEYAARGGQKSSGYEFSGSDSLDKVGWYDGNSISNSSASSETHPVGEKAPNELGLYDMSGNVDEWCFPYDFSNSPSGNLSSFERRKRGGNWLDTADECKVSYKLNVSNDEFFGGGIRLATSQP